MIIDPIGDLLSRIRNGQLRRKNKISSPNSRLRIRLLDVLQEEGFIRGYAEVEDSPTPDSRPACRRPPRSGASAIR